MKNAKRTIILFLLIIIILITGCGKEQIGSGDTATPGKVSASEIKKEYEGYINDPSTFPISFKYDGKQIKGLGEGFTESNRQTSNTETGGSKTVLTYSHEASGTDFIIETVLYETYSAYEWTMYIENNSDSTTKQFSDINAIDMAFKGSKPVMKGINGDIGKDMYKPYAESLSVGKKFEKISVSGRPTHSVFPYFNLEYGNGGSFIVLGWPGCWRASAEAKGDTTYFTGGQKDTNTYLAPGEKIRTPLVAILKYKGRDEAAAMNLWRRWYIDCNMRKIDGKEFEPVFGGFSMIQGSNTNNMLRIVKSYASHGAPLDYFWMDAGWYTDADGNDVDWPETGTLIISTKRFPDKFKSISDEIAKNGGKTLLWFEPEVVRVNKKSFLSGIPDFKEEWMLGTAMTGTWLEGQLLDLGNEECRAWLIERISTIIREGDISLYRQDFNVDPGPVWRACETDDRTGYIENQYVMGYLAFWDELIRLFPDMMIDSCASGGGRNDLETLRRSVPLHISDYWDGNAVGYDERQATMQSIMRWIPYIKLQRNDTDYDAIVYTARSSYAPWFMINVGVMDIKTPWDTVKQLKAEWESISVFYYADFYQLTPWNNDADKWRGFEYFDVDKNAGFAQLFRPSACEIAEQTIKFFGLKADSQYSIKDTDGTLDITASGKELTENGISITMPTKSYAMVIMINAV